MEKSASERIDEKIAELGDWRGETLSRMRKLIKDADPEVAEEWKWVKATNPGTPVWAHDGGICTGATYKSGVTLCARRQEPARRNPTTPPVRPGTCRTTQPYPRRSE